MGKDEKLVQFDEQLRLVFAEDDLQAFTKAQRMGEREQYVLPLLKEQSLSWKFLFVTDLYKLENMTDGAEVFSRITDADDGDNYQHQVQLKSGYLFEQCTEQFLQSI